MTINPADSTILGGLFGSDGMRRLFSDEVRLQRMLDVEAALARVQARLGIVPKDAADAITRAAKVGNLSFEELGASTRNVGYPVVALVKPLGKAAGGDAARYVHWGATTQDTLDTAIVLQIRDALGLIRAHVSRSARAPVDRAQKHRGDLMAGRTHLQHPLPVTFGYKCAVWEAPLLDDIARLDAAAGRVLRVQFGGAVGTLASLGKQGRAVTEDLA